MIKKSLLTFILVGWTVISLYAQLKIGEPSTLHAKAPLAKGSASNQNEKFPASEAQKSQVNGWLKNDKTGFVENKGQIIDQNGKPNKAVKYLLNMPGLNVQLRKTGFSYDAYQAEKGGSIKGSQKILAMTNLWH